MRLRVGARNDVVGRGLAPAGDAQSWYNETAISRKQEEVGARNDVVGRWLASADDT